MSSCRRRTPQLATLFAESFTRCGQTLAWGCAMHALAKALQRTHQHPNAMADPMMMQQHACLKSSSMSGMASYALHSPTMFLSAHLRQQSSTWCSKLRSEPRKDKLEGAGDGEANVSDLHKIRFLHYQNQDTATCLHHEVSEAGL